MRSVLLVASLATILVACKTASYEERGIGYKPADPDTVTGAPATKGTVFATFTGTFDVPAKKVSIVMGDANGVMHPEISYGNNGTSVYLHTSNVFSSGNEVWAVVCAENPGGATNGGANGIQWEITSIAPPGGFLTTSVVTFAAPKTLLET